MQMLTKRLLGSGALALALAGFSTAAHGSLVVNLVPTGGSSGVVVNGQNVTIPGSGATVNFNVVGTVTGTDTNPNNDGLQAAFGNIQADGSLIGNFASSGFAAASPFGTGNPQAGFSQDLNGDGGLDLGFKIGTDSDTTRYVAARDGGMDPSTSAASQSGGSSTFLLGTVSWTATSSSGSTVAHWVIRPSSLGTVWNEDGGTNKTGVSGAYSADPTGATISVTPEPGSLALAGVAGVGLLLRRRRK
jgi:hypothetical protein